MVGKPRRRRLLGVPFSAFVSISFYTVSTFQIELQTVLTNGSHIAARHEIMRREELLNYSWYYMLNMCQA